MVLERPMMEWNTSTLKLMVHLQTAILKSTVNTKRVAKRVKKAVNLNLNKLHSQYLEGSTARGELVNVP